MFFRSNISNIYKHLKNQKSFSKNRDKFTKTKPRKRTKDDEQLKKIQIAKIQIIEALKIFRSYEFCSLFLNLTFSVEVILKK